MHERQLVRAFLEEVRVQSGFSFFSGRRPTQTVHRRVLARRFLPRQHPPCPFPPVDSYGKKIVSLGAPGCETQRSNHTRKPGLHGPVIAPSPLTDPEMPPCSDAPASWRGYPGTHTAPSRRLLPCPSRRGRRRSGSSRSRQVPQAFDLASISAIRPSMRPLISSRMGRTASTPWPAGSSNGQSR